MFFSAYAILLPLLLAALPFGTATPVGRGCEAPYYQFKDNVPNAYIVNFTEGYTLKQHFSAVGEKFNVSQLFTGYYANLTTELFTKIRADCGIQFVQDNTFGELEADDDIDEAIPDTQQLTRRGTQQSAPWPLYQLSASSKNPVDQTYYYLDDIGKGVDVYIIDSGITHPLDEFRDDNGNDRVTDVIRIFPNTDYSDDSASGHGTAVTSAIGGKKYGIAKSANLLAVKALVNLVPTTAELCDALEQIIVRHNSQKNGASFKGSIVNMSFRIGKTPQLEDVLNRVAAAGITMVASAGNGGYDPSDRYPSSHPNVITAGASAQDYTPATFSNYGRDQVTVWAPGTGVPLCGKDGSEVSKKGTSYSSGYTAGILSIFYGVEGKSMDPDLALSRLTDQTDDWIDLDTSGGKDWHGSTRKFANTGNRKEQAKLLPKKYIGGPDVTVASDPSPPNGCQSPNHDDPATSFTLDQGNSALAQFRTDCSTELTKDDEHGCILYFNPCSEEFKAKAVDVILTVTQTEWTSNTTSDWPQDTEISDAIGHILNDCDTTTTSAKWGGYRTVTVDSGTRMYNVTANQDGQYPQPDGFHTVKVTSGGGNCDAWDSS